MSSRIVQTKREANVLGLRLRPATRLVAVAGAAGTMCPKSWELRKFRDDAQAAAEARKQAEKEKREKEEREAQFKALEEKVMSSLPQGLKDKKTPLARAHGEKAAPNPRADISPLAARLIEVLFDKQVNCQGVTSWEDVEQRLTSLDAKVLREIVENKFPDDAVPRVKAQRVAKLMELAMAECNV